jgi:drug/metabolite transporter (DMT)-like permease
MQELTFGTLIAVFEEIFGRGLFWIMVALAGLVTLAYAYVLVRDHAVSWRKFLWAQLSMPLGAVAAVWFLLAMTDSRLSDMGGAIDVIVLLGVGALGAVGLAILVYTLQSLVRPPARDD